MRYPVRRAALLAASACAIIPFQSAAAQTQPVDQLEEITVTARRFSERAQDVPASLAAFTPEAIEQAHVESLKDVTALIPNVAVSSGEQPGIVLFSVRGIGQVRNTAPPVAVVVDGVELYDINQITQGLYDLKSIEFLKGPQGAIYGRNAIGGAINITTAAPTDDLSGWVRGEYGTGNDRLFQGSVSDAIIADKLWFRAAGSLRWFDGDIKNDFLDKEANNETSQSGHMSLVAKPVDRLTVTLNASAANAESGAAWYSFVPPGTDPNAILPIESNIPGRSYRLLRNYSAKADYDFPGFTVSSITSYALTRTSLNEDFDFLQFNFLQGVQEMRNRTVSQELRIHSSDGGKLQWLAGAAYYNLKDAVDNKVFVLPGAGGVLFPFPIPSALLFAHAASSQASNAYALFGQVNYQPWDKVKINAALRYDSDQVDNHDLVADTKASKNFSSLQPQLTASYSFNSDAMVYATVGKGFRNGGFNASARITPIYKAEHAWSYELGAKTSWLDNRLIANASAFLTEDYNRQIYIFDQLTGSETVTNPVRRARIDGIEFELTALPVHGLQLGLSGGLQQSKITSYDTSVFAGLPAAGDFTGNKVPQVPEYTYSGSIQYTAPVNDDLTLTGRVEFNGSGGSYFWNVDNTASRSAINLVNLRLTADYRRFTLTAFIENVTDKKYIAAFEDQVFTGAPLGDYNLRSPGRRSGILLTARF